MQPGLSRVEVAERMTKRIILILALLVALALACTRSAPVQIELPNLLRSTPEAAVPTAPATPEGEIFLPEVSAGADETQAAAPGETAAAETAAATLTPEAASASETAEAVQATEEVQPAQTETPIPPAPNSLFLPLVGSGRAGESGGDTTGGETTPAAQSPAGDSLPGQTPSIALEATPVILQVGETLTVVGRPTGIGLPYYDLTVQDQGAQQAQVLGQVTYENQARPQPGMSQVLELVSAQGDMNQATFVLRAKAPGTAAVQISATGEVQTESGAYTWSGGSSQAIEITVEG
jgi:hypothetical protein